MSVLDQLAQPASSSRQYATFRATIIALVLVSLACLAAISLGVALPTETIATLLAPISTLGIAATGARAWHDRGVRVAAVEAERREQS